MSFLWRAPIHLTSKRKTRTSKNVFLLWPKTADSNAG